MRVKIVFTLKIIRIKQKINKGKLFIEKPESPVNNSSIRELRRPDLDVRLTSSLLPCASTSPLNV